MKSIHYAIIAVFGVMLAFADPVCAGDLGPAKDGDYDAPSAHSWTGFYIGAGAGFASAEVTRCDSYSGVYGPGVAKSGSQSQDLGAQGFLSWGQIGYDYRFGTSRLFAGAFADAAWSRAEGKEESLADGVYPGGTYSDARTTKWSLGSGRTAGGRAGVIVAAETAAYLLAGYVSSEGKVELSGDVFPDGTTSKSITARGLTVGGGLETRIGSPLYLRTEYRYSELSKEQLFAHTDGGAGLSSAETAHVKPEVHEFRVGLSYKLGDLR